MTEIFQEPQYGTGIFIVLTLAIQILCSIDMLMCDDAGLFEFNWGYEGDISVIDDCFVHQGQGSYDSQSCVLTLSIDDSPGYCPDNCGGEDLLCGVVSTISKDNARGYYGVIVKFEDKPGNLVYFESYNNEINEYLVGLSFHPLEKSLVYMSIIYHDIFLVDEEPISLGFDRTLEYHEYGYIITNTNISVYVDGVFKQVYVDDGSTVRVPPDVFSYEFNFNLFSGTAETYIGILDNGSLPINVEIQRLRIYPGATEYPEIPVEETIADTTPSETNAETVAETDTETDAETIAVEDTAAETVADTPSETVVLPEDTSSIDETTPIVVAETAEETTFDTVYDHDSETVEHSPSDTALSPGSSMLGFVFAGVGGVVVVFLLVIMLFFAVIIGVCLYSRKMKKKLDRFDEIGGETLLQEHEVEKIGSKTAPKLIVRKEMFLVDYRDVELLNELARGGSNSCIYKANYSNQLCAFKVYQTGSCAWESQTDFDEFEKELTVLANLKHPNLISFFGASLESPRVGILMEFCDHNLQQYIVKFKPKFETKIGFLLGVANGAAFLHKKKIIHRDLKPQNCMIDNSGVVKIIDFGLARPVSKNDELKTKFVGTSGFMAPEMVTSRTYDHKVDVFSYGIIIFVCIEENFHPLEDLMKESNGITQTNLDIKIAQDPDFRPRITNTELFPEWLSLLMRKCWDVDKNVRPEFSEICEIIVNNQNPK